MDGFWELSLKAWDTSAGALIVGEAGGRVTTLDGSPFTSHVGEVVATNGLIHEQMLDIIRPWRTASLTTRSSSTS
jgi:myo-inositol-1(or 4)-monophosphatase